LFRFLEASGCLKKQGIPVDNPVLYSKISRMQVVFSLEKLVEQITL
jgi:hypothetical protein